PSASGRAASRRSASSCRGSRTGTRSRWRRRPVGAIPQQLVQIDICFSVAVALGPIDTIRGADYSARHLLLALRVGEPMRVARALAFDQCVPGYVLEAERRGDRYLAVSLRVKFHIVWLLCDDTVDAERDIDDAMASWVRVERAFMNLHQNELHACCE